MSFQARILAKASALQSLGTEKLSTETPELAVPNFSATPDLLVLAPMAEVSHTTPTLDQTTTAAAAAATAAAAAAAAAASPAPQLVPLEELYTEPSVIVFGGDLLGRLTRGKLKGVRFFLFSSSSS